MKQKNNTLSFLSCSVINACSSCPVFVQSWTERAKGQTGDAADLKKRKRAKEEEEERGGVENENGQAEADETSAKKKKSLDPSSKLSAFAFNKN